MDMVSAKDFMKVVYGNITEKEINSVLNVLNDFVEGETLLSSIKKHNLSYRKFRYIVAQHPNISIMFEDMISLHKDSLKENLVDRLISLCNKNDFKAITFALERIFPDEYGRRVEVTNKNVEDRPKILERFVNAEYTKQ